jgi:hypothetical protein
MAAGDTENGTRAALNDVLNGLKTYNSSDRMKALRCASL